MGTPSQSRVVSQQGLELQRARKGLCAADLIAREQPAANPAPRRGLPSAKAGTLYDGRMSQAPEADPRPGAAADWLVPEVYAQLRRIAQQRLRQQRTDHTLQATALVHEAFLRMNRRPGTCETEAHFYFAAARAMQDILVEHARSRSRQKRGGDGRGSAPVRVPLDVLDLAMESNAEDVLALNEAVDALAQAEPEVAAVVQLRFYAGLTGEEVARCLGTSPRQVDRHWAYARAWLFERLGGAD
jgi:RNA polymerase sigma factor (TIGR02999 family)